MSGFLWMRKWRVLVIDAQDKEALNVSDLRIKFTVKKSREVSNFANVEIYNLNAETEARILKEGDRLIIEAGYEGYLETSADGEVREVQEKQYGKIFDGKIIYPTRRKENNTDYVLSLLCIDGRNIMCGNLVSKTLNKGLNQRQVLEAVCEKAKATIPTNEITQGLSGQKLPRGKVVFGEAIDFISDIARGNAATYWVQDGKLNVGKITDVAKGDAIVVTPQTGLISMPTQTQYGANFRLLLNPTVGLWGMVQIKNSEIVEAQVKPGDQQKPLDEDWIYQVTELVHTGDTRGNDWYTDCSAVSRGGKTALAALCESSAQNPNGV